MISAQVVETSVINNSSFHNYPHPDDHTIRTTDTPGFKPFTNKNMFSYITDILGEKITTDIWLDRSWQNSLYLNVVLSQLQPRSIKVTLTKW